MIIIVFVIGIFPGALSAQEPSNKREILAPDKFDEWGDIPFSDEKLRLNKIAIQAKEWPLSVIYLVIHAGQTACAGEAKARGIRAKKYLMSSVKSHNRIELIDAGWRNEVAVEVWIWPPELGKPISSPDLNLKRSEVKIERNCKLKYRGP